ncbi:MAG: hypothetical protein Q7T88_09360, partial [Methylotenera sp.]|nr:hypothetical protein [Methylotenera sp.]
AAANNTVTADRAIRNYRAITGAYPNQWDNLSIVDSGLALPDSLLAEDTLAAFGNFNLATSTASGDIADAMEDVGLEEFQTITTASGLKAGVVPNLQHNEGANPGSDEMEIDSGLIQHISIVPAGAGCTAGGASIADNYAATAPTLDEASGYLNRINDSLETGICHLVLAVGFGHDAAHSTFDSTVAIAAAPTFTSKKINPSVNYARYIALFHLGSAGATTPLNVGDNAGELRATPRLIGVVAPDGTILDNALAAAKAAN